MRTNITLNISDREKARIINDYNGDGRDGNVGVALLRLSKDNSPRSLSIACRSSSILAILKDKLTEKDVLKIIPCLDITQINNPTVAIFAKWILLADVDAKFTIPDNLSKSSIIKEMIAINSTNNTRYCYPRYLLKLFKRVSDCDGKVDNDALGITRIYELSLQ